MNLTTLAGRLEFVRSLLGVSARTLSVEVGLSPGMWALLESGEKTQPRASTLTLISTRLSIDLTWIATGAGRMLKDRPELDASNEADRPSIAAAVLAVFTRPRDAQPPQPPPTPPASKRRRSVARTTAPPNPARTTSNSATRNAA